MIGCFVSYWLIFQLESKIWAPVSLSSPNSPPLKYKKNRQENELMVPTAIEKQPPHVCRSGFAIQYDGVEYSVFT